MDLQWYLFEHSYLIGLNVDPIACSLTLHIDAKITYEHPKAKKKTIEESIEESFEDILIVFRGVQYLRMINSINILTNPNDDLGSIEKLEFISTDSISSRLNSFEKKTMIINSKKIFFLNFASEMINFEIGFEKYDLLLIE